MAARQYLIVTLLSLHATTAAAQDIRARITGTTPDEPVVAAMVVLLDERGTERARAITDASGAFTMRAPAAGRYTFSVERIGYLNTTSDTIVVRDGTNTFVIPIAAQPITLPALEASTGPRECGRTPQGSDVFTIWSEIRKALQLSEASAAARNAHFTMLKYVRDLDPDRSAVVSEQRVVAEGTASHAYRAIDQGYLEREGYLIVDGEDYLFAGPDEAVLLSDAFVRTHCLRIRRGRTRDEIGLAFEPARRQRFVDVKGVLWLDRNTARLRMLEYEYLNLPGLLARHGASGAVHFAQLTDGVWAITKWWIRTPRFAQVGSSARPRFDMIGWREDGGAVLAARSDERALLELIGGGAVRGTVHDSITNRPLPDVYVTISTTNQSTKTAADGTFEIIGVPEGTHDVAFIHPELAELEVPMPIQRVHVTPGAQATITLTTPALPNIMRVACPADETTKDPRPTLIFGVARPFARVRAAWQTATENHWRDTEAAANGAYVLCWLPENATISLSAEGTPAIELRRRTAVHRHDFER